LKKRVNIIVVAVNGAWVMEVLGRGWRWKAALGQHTLCVFRRLSKIFWDLGRPLETAALVLLAGVEVLETGHHADLRSVIVVVSI
jgi:hypothetical protein